MILADIGWSACGTVSQTGLGIRVRLKLRNLGGGFVELSAALNEQQLAAVEYCEGPLLILAGAGSGKTRVLIHRIAWLLRQGVAPERILAITFTNKAAQEMRDRATALVGVSISRMWISTFHAACVRILRRDIETMGYRTNFTIVDAGDSERIIRSVIKDLNLDDKRYPTGELSTLIDRAKNDMIDVSAYRSLAKDTFERNVALVYALYQDQLLKTNSLDFNDLINLTVRLFEEHPDVLARYQDQFQYLMVDEYQDTNHSQYRLVRLLAAPHQRICVVGDDDQGIYSWRGADISNILNFARDYPQARVIKLEQNYRSTQNILDAAWHVISKNLSRTEKRLWTERHSSDLVILQCLQNEHAEAQAIVLEIERIRAERHLKYSDFAVLYRVHSQSRVIEEKLIQRRIPYTIYSGLRFFERAEVKDVLAYLRVLVNPYDDQSMRRIINVPRRGIGDTTLSHVQEFAQQMQIPWYVALEMAEEIPNLNNRTVRRLTDLWRLLDDLRKMQEYLSVSELTEELLHRTGYRDLLEGSLKTEDQERLANLGELLNVTAEYDRRREEGQGLMEFLAEVALLSSSDLGDEELLDRVMLMSLHSAKGLEFSVVFLTGMEEGLFPFKRALDNDRELEEERRLCYVGMTRAKDLLYLSYTEGRAMYGQMFPAIPSRFLADIPKELIYDRKQPSRQKALQATTWSSSPPPSLFYESSRTITADKEAIPRMVGQMIITINVGDRVWHRNWEEGTVLSIKGSGEDTMAEVEFHGVGKKLLLLKFAGLEKVE
ncbi:MAG: UvrD-helicase domain-containing protein [Symbiobacteriaceae bacterium]|nr:UvrD-helicase domain-containing protein [Symbiobacteriaceae bacterium]